MSSHVRSVPEDDSAEWETQSEEEILMPQPPVKEDALLETPRMIEVPISAMSESPSMKWASRIFLYSHPNKTYERIIVSSIFITQPTHQT